jgi:hypothetical protein
MQRRTEDVIRETEAQIAATYRKYPSLALTDAQIAARALRQRADAIEAAENERLLSDSMRQQASALGRCEQIIVASLQNR